jgi:hypothetical protein
MAAVSDAAHGSWPCPQRRNVRFAKTRACAAVVQVPDIADRRRVEHSARTVVGRRRDGRPFTSGMAPPGIASVITRPVSLPLSLNSRPIGRDCAGDMTSALLTGAVSTKPDLKSGAGECPKSSRCRRGSDCRACHGPAEGRYRRLRPGQGTGSPQMVSKLRKFTTIGALCFGAGKDDQPNQSQQTPACHRCHCSDPQQRRRFLVLLHKIENVLYFAPC